VASCVSSHQRVAARAVEQCGRRRALTNGSDRGPWPRRGYPYSARNCARCGRPFASTASITPRASMMQRLPTAIASGQVCQVISDEIDRRVVTGDAQS
jgi:hypothetical protein